MKKMMLIVSAIALAAASSRAGVVISEVHSTGSSSSYACDFFELTNTGAASVDIAGWKMDDNSNSYDAAVALTDVTSIAPGQSVVFIEGDATDVAAFETAWFGSNVPAGFAIGCYTGSGIGLSSNGDSVNIFDADKNLVTAVSFGSGSLGVSFDNAAGAGGTVLPYPMLSTLSVAGVNGAFLSAIGEIGSPGVVPEPSSIALLIALAATMLVGFAGKRFGA